MLQYIHVHLLKLYSKSCDYFVLVQEGEGKDKVYFRLFFSLHSKGKDFSLPRLKPFEHSVRNCNV